MKSERYRLDANIQADIYLITLRTQWVLLPMFSVNRKN